MPGIRVLVVALLMACRPPVPQVVGVPEADWTPAQIAVRELLFAMHNGDVDTVLKHTHPVAVAQLGGIEEARAALARAAEQSQSAGMRVERFTFPAPQDVFPAGDSEFAFVPTLTVLVAANGRRVESLNFQMGVRAKGTSRWGFVEGSRLTDGNVRELFPDFPRGKEFPPTYRRVL